MLTIQFHCWESGIELVKETATAIWVDLSEGKTSEQRRYPQPLSCEGIRHRNVRGAFDGAGCQKD
jgi:hypothetical protein